MWHLTLSRSRPPPRLVSVRVKEQYIKSAVGFSSQANLQLECVLPIVHFAGFCAIKSWEGRGYFLNKDPLKFWKSLKPVPPHCRPRFSQAESCTPALISSFHHSIRPFSILYGLKRVVWRRQKLNERFHNISFDIRTVLWAVAYITGHVFHPGFRFLLNHYVERTLSVLIFYRREIRHSTLWLYSEPGKAWPDCTQLMVVLLQKRSMPCNNDTQWLFHNTWEESHELSEFDLDILDTLLDDISIYFFYQEIMICYIKALFPLQTRCLSGDDVFIM